MSHLLVIALFMGILPMLVYATLLWWLDCWEPEPVRLLVGALAWGAGPAVLLTMWLHAPLTQFLSLMPGLVESSTLPRLLAGPLIEECSKGVGVLIVYYFFHHELDSWLDGILYGSAVGFGFAAVENVVYFYNFGQSHPESLSLVIFLRAFAFGLNHACFTSFLGIAVIQARYSRLRRRGAAWIILGLTLAVLLHVVHNWLVIPEHGGVISTLVVDWLGVSWISFTVLMSLRRQQRWMREYLAEEVELGTLTPQQAVSAASFRNRLRFTFRKSSRADTATPGATQVWQLCAELALKKHQSRHSASNARYAAAIHALRMQLTSINSQKTSS